VFIVGVEHTGTVHELVPLLANSKTRTGAHVMASGSYQYEDPGVSIDSVADCLVTPSVTVSPAHVTLHVQTATGARPSA
jgi:hypothetical protein